MVSIIVVTCGSHNYLQACIGSLQQQTHRDLEAIVINNSLSENSGLFYSGALNKGIMMSKGEFVLCLNDDVILEQNFIEEALKGFEIDERVGMVSGKILRFDKKTIDTTGLFLSCWRTAEERGYGRLDKGQFEKAGYIFGVNGAVAFYRRAMLEEVKTGAEYFDSDFHFFFEDLDIAWRAERKNWKGYYIPKAIAYHLRGGSVRAMGGINKPYARRFLSDDLHFDYIKNRYLTIIKNESIFGFLVFLPFMFSYNLLMWGYVLIFRPRLVRRFILEAGPYLRLARRKRGNT